MAPGEYVEAPLRWVGASIRRAVTGEYGGCASMGEAGGGTQRVTVNDD